jgi:hypothetical protein
MSESQAIEIRTALDIIAARSRVRDLARAVGLGTVGQARISLATSSLARALGMGISHTGQIVATPVNGEGRKGLQVVCMALNGANGETPGALNGLEHMVDGLDVVSLPSGQVQATLIQWVE